MFNSFNRTGARRGVATAVAAAALLTACSEPTSPDYERSGRLSRLIGDRSGTPDFMGQGIVLACSFGTEDGQRPDAGFASSATGGTLINSPTGSFTIPGTGAECMEIWNATGATTQTVTVTLVSYPGFVLDRIVRVGGTAIESAVITGTNTASISVNDVTGGMLWFKLLPGDEPPPPNGGQGCTPGYWKQSQHFDSWVGYSPNQLFSSVFENAFPGMTLLQVLGQGGGGLKALGRHSVAALLNASSAGVSYDYGNPADVIGAFNAAYPGSNGAYEMLKNRFEMLNEQGCPLN